MLWIEQLARQLSIEVNTLGPEVLEQTREERFVLLIREHLPKNGSPLLECIECHNTESPAAAIARHFNYGRCLHCAGYFKVKA